MGFNMMSFGGLNSLLSYPPGPVMSHYDKLSGHLDFPAENCREKKFIQRLAWQRLIPLNGVRLGMGLHWGQQSKHTLGL